MHARRTPIPPPRFRAVVGPLRCLLDASQTPRAHSNHSHSHSLNVLCFQPQANPTLRLSRVCDWAASFQALRPVEITRLLQRLNACADLYQLINSGHNRDIGFVEPRIDIFLTAEKKEPCMVTAERRPPLLGCVCRVPCAVCRYPSPTTWFIVSTDWSWYTQA
jgi:hypothetical protein